MTGCPPARRERPNWPVLSGQSITAQLLSVVLQAGNPRRHRASPGRPPDGGISCSVESGTLRKALAEAVMGLMDKVRAQSTQLAQMAQETAREGKVKLDQAQAKRRADAMFRDLGATVYAERTGRGTPDSTDKIDRLVDALSRQEASQGLGDPDGSAPGATPQEDTSPGSTPPES
jgi:hypothetical protein